MNESPGLSPECPPAEHAILTSTPARRVSPWSFYDELIAGIPEDIAVHDYCLGTKWSYVQAECGCGVSFTCSGGAIRTDDRDLRKASLRNVAQLAKSWCFEEATLGVAALNAWYNRPDLINKMGARYDKLVDLPEGAKRKIDAFEMLRPYSTGKNVAVVGHFPHVDRILEYASGLTVLERRCSSDLDTPDPACEYAMPEADVAFITGVTVINKTAPRLLDLTRRAVTVMTGPSVVISPMLFECGADVIAGSVVADAEKAAFAVKNGKGQFFGEALQMITVGNVPA